MPEDAEVGSSDSTSSGEESGALLDNVPRSAGARAEHLPAAIAAAEDHWDAALVPESRRKDKQDRATVEQVLDPRTRRVLSKLLRNGVLSALHGCVATGKEANVYHARAPAPDGGDGRHVAVKIFKTSILAFKDRAKYVVGERRFQGGYAKPRNPRKMVKLWAEKEFRNLMRLRDVGIACPQALLLRDHVLVMSFCGDTDGRPAPRLCELGRARADRFSAADEWSALYTGVAAAMRRLYQRARLVHGDLSEYNLLYWQQQVYFIDVSQSMERDHPYALDFLRRDCHNVSAFFRAQVARFGGGSEALERVLTARRLFEYVVAAAESSEESEAALLAAALRQQRQALQSGGAALLETADDEVVFEAAYIPRRLDELDEEDVERVYYDGMLRPASAFQEEHGDREEVGQDAEESVATTDASGTDGEVASSAASDTEGADADAASAAAHADERARRKLHQKQVKAEQRERRQHKIPKKVKRRAQKRARARRRPNTGDDGGTGHRASRPARCGFRLPGDMSMTRE